MKSLNAVGLWICVVFLCSSSGGMIQAVQAKKGRPPKTLVLFGHESQVDPGRTSLIVASPSSTSGTMTVEFGAINVFSNLLRTSAENTSAVLGKAVGQGIFLIDLSTSVAFSFVLNTTSYAGTIIVHGVLSNGEGELVVTGGTEDFRLVRGYCEVLTVTATDLSDMVFKNTLHLDYVSKPFQWSSLAKPLKPIFRGLRQGLHLFFFPVTWSASIFGKIMSSLTMPFKAIFQFTLRGFQLLFYPFTSVYNKIMGRYV